MKVYLIYACETQYYGLHGMYDWDIVECDSEEEAIEIGRSMSEAVIESYSSLIDGIEEEVQVRLSEDGLRPEDFDYDERYDELYDSILNDSIEYSYWELDPSIPYHEIIDPNTDWEEIRDKYSINYKGE